MPITENENLVLEITRARFIELLDAEAQMICLDNSGVDNWEGCDIAFKDLEEVKTSQKERTAINIGRRKE